MRRDLVPVLAVAWFLVFLRSAIYLSYPQSFFDSDQAIVGLMAKHLVEGRAFPLFYYGQAYLLALDAWFAAPFFLVAGPTLEALRISIICTNIAAVTVIIVGLTAGGVGRWHALVASTFFAFAPPMTAGSLVELGANIGPFLFVPVLWFLRGRPLWFGAMLAVGFLYRDFTIYAVPVLVIGQVIDGTLRQPEVLRGWALALLAFLVVWFGFTALRPVADLRGPGTRGVPIEGTTGSQVQNIVARLDIDVGALGTRTLAMALQQFPRQIGAVASDGTMAEQGRDWVRWPLGLALIAALVRAIRFGRGGRAPAFTWYLLGVGLTAAGVYILTRPADEFSDRYILLTIFVPIGIVAAYLASEPVAVWRRAMVAVVIGWCTLSAVDHARLAARYLVDPYPDHIQFLADTLDERGIEVAVAGYWRAYKVTFIAQERVKVASTELARIDEYQRLVGETDQPVVTIREIANGGCEGGEVIGIWVLCRD